MQKNGGTIVHFGDEKLGSVSPVATRWIEHVVLLKPLIFHEYSRLQNLKGRGIGVHRFQAVTNSIRFFCVLFTVHKLEANAIVSTS